MNDKSVTLWGDFFNTDTRSVYIALKMADVEFEMKEINTLEREHFGNDYMNINATSSVPTIVNKSSGKKDSVIANLL